MINRDKIAVIILTYDRFEDFKLALKSALMQKNVLFHIFVFDNGSKKPVSTIIGKNPQVTYVRHKKNIGFAANFKFATKYVKDRGFKLSFLLGDDDMIAYSNALKDLLVLMNKDKNTHVVRGGYAEFIHKLPQFTRITIHDDNYCQKLSGLSEIDKALVLHITSYSGILFRNEMLEPYFCPFDDLVSPLMAPLLKILTQKEFAFLSDKITMFIKTEHSQLARDLYNQSVSNQDALEKSLKLLGKSYKRYVSVVELVNFKIYSQNSKNINKYYQECLNLNKGWKAIPYIITFYLPVHLLRLLKNVYKNITTFLVNQEIKNKHKYLGQIILK